VIDYLRLAFGTVVVLLPGAAVARAFGQRSMSALLAWSLTCVFVAWLAVFALHSNIRLAALVLAALGVAGVVAARRRHHARRPRRELARRATLGLGVVLGWALWHVADVYVGDGLFHEGRVRKLVELGDLHLRTVDEFKDGGLHPGYAFPLWHGFLALIAWVSGLDPETVVRHAPSTLAPLACVVAWEAGMAVLGSRWAGTSMVLVTLALFCFGAGHGGSFEVLGLPATATRQLLAPAAIALFFTARSRLGWLTVAAIFGVIALSHPTYALFLLIPLLVVVPWHWRSWLAGAVPTGLVLLWLKPIVDDTISHTPKAGELMRGIVQYRDQLVVHGPRDFHVAPEVFGRTGAVAVAALVLLPLAAFALPRRWAVFSLGGTLLVMLIGNVSWLFVHFSDVVGLSQSRRAIGFAPWPFAFVGVTALLARRVLVLPVALVAGIMLQRVWPGDFVYGLHHGGPAAATWIALVGGFAALVLALALRPRPPQERWGLGTAVVACFCLPVFVHGLWHWTPTKTSDPLALSPSLLESLRTRVPQGAVVIAPLETSYRVAARVPVYVVGAPVTHVAATTANKPYQRAKDVQRWVRTGDPAIARRYGATWQIREGRLSRVP
jgi:hypothetical protein